MPTLDEFKKQLEKKRGAAQRAFATEDGSAILAALEARFVLGDLAGPTPEQTYFNLGAREVVVYLRSLVTTKTTGES